MSDVPRESRSSIGWPRAALTAAGVVVVGVGLLVYVPNAILTRASGLDRSGRVALATACFAVALAVVAVALRWTQRRDLL